MRSLVIGASLSVVALVLQGCGGGGGPAPAPAPGPAPAPAGKCVNDKINLVTQSSTGTITGTVAGIPNMPMPSIPLDVPFTEKIDLDNFNVRYDASMTFSSLNLAAKVIFNAAKQEAVVQYTMGEKTACKKKSIPTIPDPATIKIAWNSMILPKMQEAAKCAGNDGTDDTWNVDVSHNGPVPGVPGSADVTVTAEIKMDKDYLMHEVNVKASAKVTDPQAMDIEINLDVKYDAPTATGPTASDLDYSGWGTCDPATVSNVDELFNLGDDSKEAKLLEMIMGQSIFGKTVTESLQASLKSQKKEKKQVVV